MKVLQVNKLYYPSIGGIETVVQNIAEGLNERTEMEVLVCQAKGKAKSEIINDVFVSRSGSLGTYFSMPVSFSFISDFKKKSRNADIIHIHLPFPLADIACLLSGYEGKIVLSWHSDIVKQEKMMILYRPIMEKLLHRVDKIIVATQGHILGSKYLRPYGKKCCIIPYGLNIEEYEDIDEVKPFLTERLNSRQNVKALFTGRLVYYKGVDVLIKAFKNVYGCELFIVGSGKLEQELKNMVNTMGMESKVHFLGNLLEDDLKQAYADCDFFILPSVERSEAFGIVQMEAMVYGKPVINTKLPTGVPYVSVNGETGITVPVNDIEALTKAIQILADDDELRRKYGENAFKRVRDEFNMDKMLNDIYVLYEELLRGTRKEGL